jgi:hypothetical protein
MRNNLHDCPKNSRICMGIYMWRGERRPPLRECGVYMYIYRPLDDARPGELDGEGWGSDDD